jgi:hypothetical protein
MRMQLELGAAKILPHDALFIVIDEAQQVLVLLQKAGIRRVYNHGGAPVLLLPLLRKLHYSLLCTARREEYMVGKNVCMFGCVQESSVSGVYAESVHGHKNTMSDSQGTQGTADKISLSPFSPIDMRAGWENPSNSFTCSAWPFCILVSNDESSCRQKVSPVSQYHRWPFIGPECSDRRY